MKARATMKKSKLSKPRAKKSKAMAKKSKTMAKKSKSMAKKSKTMAKKSKKRGKRGGIGPQPTVSAVSQPGTGAVAANIRAAVQGAMGAAREKMAKQLAQMRDIEMRAYQTKEHTLDSMLREKNMQNLTLHMPTSLPLNPRQTAQFNQLDANAKQEFNKALDGVMKRFNWNPTQNDRQALMREYYAPIQQGIKDLASYTMAKTNVVENAMREVQKHPGHSASEAYGGPGFSVTREGKVMDALVRQYPDFKSTIITEFREGRGLHSNLPAELLKMHNAKQERLMAEHHARELHEAQLQREAEEEEDPDPDGLWELTRQATSGKFY